jgi:hypothetical protein
MYINNGSNVSLEMDELTPSGESGIGEATGEPNTGEDISSISIGVSVIADRG